MKITICGSMQFDAEMSRAKDWLEQLGFEIDKPNVVEGHVYTDNLDANAELKKGFINEHFRKIDTSDAILVVNETKNGIDNYIGGNTLIEIAYAYAQGLEIFLLNPTPEVSYGDEINGMSPIILDGDLAKIGKYFDSLPQAFVSSESPIKLRAVSRALRRAGIATKVSGKKVPSGVEEQPMTIDETYKGAMTRHTNLKQLADDKDYYVTVESGVHVAHEERNAFGCTVVLLEKAGQKVQVGIDLDIEFPKEMLDKVPSVYPDYGILVQQEFNSKYKDPIQHLTNGKLTRMQVVENAVYRLVIQQP